MKLLDSNILIYSSLNEFSYLKDLIIPENFISEISLLEVLGFHKISLEEKIFFTSVFNIVKIVPINRNIIDKAIYLKQENKLSIGDSIISATALLFDLEILTRNEKDFTYINGIKTSNPIKNS